VLCLNQKSIDRVQQLTELVNIQIINIGKITGIIKFKSIYSKKDYVLFNTILLRNLFITVIISIIAKNKIYYIRNVNSWFNKPNSDVPIKNRVLGNILFFTKKILLKRAKLLAIGSYNMQKYLSNKTDKESFIIPFNIFEKNNIFLVSNNRYTIVIPGTIDLIRKDLRIIAEATYLLDNIYLHKLNIILLGRPMSEKDKIFVEDWKNKIGDTLRYYDKFIKDDEFESVLKSANIIMGTLNVNYQDQYGNQEIYGQSKDTGIEAHAIAYAKPLFLNNDYTVDQYLTNTTLKFKDAIDCSVKIKSLINRNILFNDGKLLSNSNNYGISRLKTNIEGIINNETY
jgi:hypothetical protein